MESLNRFIVILLALAIGGAAVVAILVTVGTLGSDNLPAGWFEPQIEWLSEASGSTLAIVVAVSVAVALLMLGLIVAELVTLGRNNHRFVVSSEQGGATTVTGESVRSLAEHVGREVRGVNNVQCRVGEKEDGMAIACTAWVDLGSSLPDLSRQLRDDIRRVAEETTGLPVNSLDVDLRYQRARLQHLALR